MQDKIIAHLARLKFHRYFIFSDTVVLWSFSTQNSSGDVRLIIDLASTLQKIAAANMFILRGCAAHGDIEISENYILGSAYLRAYHHESSVIRRPLIAILKQDIENCGALAQFNDQCESVETKSGSPIEAVVIAGIAKNTADQLANEALAALAISESSDNHRHVDTWLWYKDRFGKRS